MEQIIFKLCFKSAVHFGKRRLSESENFFMADTLFSSLCIEASNDTEILDNLVSLFKNGNLQISDAMPYIDESFYIPKPMLKIDFEDNSDSVAKKNFKKLKYIPIDMLEDYINGEVDPVFENTILKELGSFEIRTMASSRDSEKVLDGEALPYEVGCYTFSQNCGLYFILGYKNETDKGLITKLLTSLSFSGIGGKRTSGFGRFTFEEITLDEEFKVRFCKTYEKQMSLSVSMAKETEIEKTLINANYLLTKRSGFIQSNNYSDSLRKKRDFYSFVAGSCFETAFEGDIFEVGGNGNHPVYRYAKPFFLGVR